MRIYLALVGVFLLAAGSTLIAKRLRMPRASSRAVGKITSYLERAIEDEGHRRSFFPVITFPAHDGQMYTFTAAAGYGSRKYAEGQPVAVLYETAQPPRAFIESFHHL
ncbi:MAG: DUF3592 domain-containing protein [Deltaproteobacteria bacterium]